MRRLNAPPKLDATINSIEATSLSASSRLHEALGGADDVVDGDAELLVQDVGGGRCTEVIDTDELALLADPALPTEAAAGLDGHAPGDGGGQHALLVLSGLSGEQLPAGHGHNAHLYGGQDRRQERGQRQYQRLVSNST